MQHIDKEMVQAQCKVLLYALWDNGPMSSSHEMFCGPIANRALAQLFRLGWVGWRNGRDAIYLTPEGEDESPIADALSKG
ncbi:hypothetical protein BCO9919_07456 [Burkholderia cenocepacia]|uniref:Uncharacterized protein n=1 Tax=Burkholderia cenocepacia TaxID=95486 RepID=A0A6J5JX82_9BURK|nr:hypothetical protein BCO9919_07456 [Burkholderia cenocepacia]